MQDEGIKSQIVTQLLLQLHNIFSVVDQQCISQHSDKAYERCKESISALNNKYLKCDDGTPKFCMNHSGCWSVYLYYLSNTLWHSGETVCAEQIYYLNKIMHSVDWYCEIELPEHFMVEHPLGSVLGKAKYGDYLLIYQGVTVGGNIELHTGETVYPILGNNVLMYADSKILGNSHIGNNVILSANACVINQNIPDDSVVFGMSPHLVIKNMPREIEVSSAVNWNKTTKGEIPNEIL